MDEPDQVFQLLVYLGLGLILHFGEYQVPLLALGDTLPELGELHLDQSQLVFDDDELAHGVFGDSGLVLDEGESSEGAFIPLLPMQTQLATRQ